ncbi:MAG: hypothetical protein HOL31_11105 [Candidatus Scalindua sp.]|nr:hypothetical protein [Candidatus Scalindua sp.]
MYTVRKSLLSVPLKTVLAVILIMLCGFSSVSAQSWLNINDLDKLAKVKGNIPDDVLTKVFKSIDFTHAKDETLFLKALEDAGKKAGYKNPTVFADKIRGALDKKRFRAVENILDKIYAKYPNGGIKAAVRTGSSGQRHLALNKKKSTKDLYRLLFSDDDISFIGNKGIAAASEFNEALSKSGLDKLKVKGFDLGGLKKVRGIDLVALDFMETEKFLGASGLSGIKQETLKKGAIIADFDGKKLVKQAEGLGSFTTSKKNHILSEIFDISNGTKKYGALTMIGSTERQIMLHGGWEKLSNSDRVKYVRRQVKALEVSGALKGKKLGQINKILDSKVLDEKIFSQINDIRLKNIKLGFEEIPRKLEPILRKAESIGTKNLMTNNEIRKVMDELTTGFSLLKDNRFLLGKEEQILARLKAVAGEDKKLYSMLYTSFKQSQDMVEVTSNWIKSGKSREAFVEMLAESSKKYGSLKAVRKEANNKALKLLKAREARTLSKAERKALKQWIEITEEGGSGYLIKMAQSPKGKVLMAVVLASGSIKAMDAMYHSWESGELSNDLSAGAFALIDFVPGAIAVKSSLLEGLNGKTILLFVKEALYFSPAWPLVLTGDLLMVGGEITSGIQLSIYNSGLIDILVYDGKFDENTGKFVRLELPDNKIIEKKDLKKFFFQTKYVKISHKSIESMGVRINDLSEATKEVFVKQYLEKDSVYEQYKRAVEEQAKAIAEEEHWDPPTIGSKIAKEVVNYLFNVDKLMVDYFCSKSEENWCKVFNLMKTKMEKRKEHVINNIMIPHLIELAEVKRATLDAGKRLKPKLAKLQKKLETLRGSKLEVNLVEVIEKQAKERGKDKSSWISSDTRTKEDKALGQGNIWEQAISVYYNIYNFSKTIKTGVETKTGYKLRTILGFRWSGNYAQDLVRAEQSKLGYAKELTRIRNDISEIKGEKGDPKDTVDRKAFAILGDVAFNWRNGEDFASNAKGTDNAAICPKLDNNPKFVTDYKEALNKVKELYGKSIAFQKMLDEGAEIIAGSDTLTLEVWMPLDIKFKNKELKKLWDDRDLSITWSATPGGKFAPKNNKKQVKFHTIRAEPTTISVLVVRTIGATKVQGTLEIIKKSKVSDNFLNLSLSKKRPGSHEIITADASIPRLYIGGKTNFIYKWSGKNCSVEDKDLMSTAVTTKAKDTIGIVTVELYVKDSDDKLVKLATKSAEFTVMEKEKTDDEDEKEKKEEERKELAAEEERLKKEEDGHLRREEEEFEPDQEWRDEKDANADDDEGPENEENIGSTFQDEFEIIYDEHGGFTIGESANDKEEEPTLQKPEKSKEWFLNCLCKYDWTGGASVWYQPGQSEDSECSQIDLSRGPCVMSGFGCGRFFFKTSQEAIDYCSERGNIPYGKYTTENMEMENKKSEKPLEVKLTSSKTELLSCEKGDVSISVSANYGRPPYTYSWPGHEGDGSSISFAPQKDGANPVTVIVTDSKGNTGTGSINIQVKPVTVSVQKVAPSGSRVVVGQKVSLKAILTAGGKTVNCPFTYRWEPHPRVTFSEHESTSPSTTATFSQPGRTPVWVIILEKRGEELVTVSESQQIQIEVIAPELNITVDPETPLVGQETRAIIQANPDPGKGIDFRWMPLPNNARELRISQNSRELVFIPKGTKPILIEAMGRVPGTGDDLGRAKITISAKSYAVTVKNLGPLGPKPMIWKQGTGLVEETKTLAVHQNVQLQADIKPVNKAKVYYKWTLNEDSHFAGGNTGQQVTLNRSQIGNCEATVTVTDKEGIVLGKGSGQFSVSISQNTLDKSKNSKKGKTKLSDAKALWKKGDLEQAVTKANEALAISPDDKEAQKLTSEYKLKKAEIDNHVATAKNFLQQSKLPEAKKELAKASKLNSEYEPLESLKKDWKKKLDVKLNDLKKAEDLKRNAASLEKQGKLKEAAEMYEQANKLAPVLKLDSKVKSLKGSIAAEDKEISQAKDLAREADLLERQGKFKEARVKYEEAQKLAPAMNLDAKIESTRKSVKNEVQAKRLEQEAMKLEKDGRLKDALSKYKQAQNISPNQHHKTEIGSKYNALEKKMYSVSNAESLLSQAEALEKVGKLSEAKTKYAQALQMHPDQNEKKRIRSLENRVIKKEQDFKKTKHLSFEGITFFQKEQYEKSKNKFEEARKLASTLKDRELNDKIQNHLEAIKHRQSPKYRAGRLRYDAAELEKSGSVTKALVMYREAQKIYHDPGQESKITSLQSMVDRQRYYEEGSALEEQGLLEQAIEKYELALKARWDSNNELRIKQLKVKVKKNRLLSDGKTFENQGMLQAAIDKYEQALKLGRDLPLESKIIGLQKKVKSREKQRQREHAAVSSGNSGGSQISGSLGNYTITRNAAISGYNNKHLTNVSPEECARLCEEETSFVCKSFDYYKRERACDLSDKSADEVGGLKTDYGGNPYDHYARQIYTNRTEPEKEKKVTTENSKVIAGKGSRRPIGDQTSVRNGTDSITLSKKIFEPGEPMDIVFTASPQYPHNSWVGLFKSNLPHDGMNANNNHELAYKPLGNKAEGIFAFTAPTKEGEYDFRMFERSNGKEVVTIKFTVAVDKDSASLKLSKRVFEPGEPMKLTFTASPLYPHNSWVGLFKTDLSHDGMNASNNHELAYKPLGNKAEGIFDFTAPTQEGQYDFRMFERSNGKEVVTIIFTVAVNKDYASLKLSKRIFEPGESVNLTFTASPLYPNNSWVGLFKADLPHDGMAANNNHELAYKTLESKAEGIFDFTAPTREGEYDFRTFERSNGKEVATIKFTVAVDKDSASLRLSKRVFEPGEPMKLTFTASPLYPHNSWVGLFKTDLPHDGMNVSNNHELAYKPLGNKAKGTFDFTAPTQEGQYDFRMFERSNGKEVVTIIFNVSKNPGSGGSAVSAGGRNIYDNNARVRKNQPENDNLKQKPADKPGKTQTKPGTMLQGTFRGPVKGDAIQGTMTLTIAMGRASGKFKGTADDAQAEATISASYDPQKGTIKGTMFGKWWVVGCTDSSFCDGELSGSFTGTQQKNGFTGTWQGSGGLSSESGTWSVSK